jgi:hypothetical protein
MSPAYGHSLGLVRGSVKARSQVRVASITLNGECVGMTRLSMKPPDARMARPQLPPAGRAALHRPPERLGVVDRWMKADARCQADRKALSSIFSRLQIWRHNDRDRRDDQLAIR